MLVRLKIAALASVAMVTISTAQELSPASGRTVEIGGYNGVVFYTTEDDGYRVVTTLASRGTAPPIRFVTTLVSGQEVLISVPRALGQPASDLEISRDGTTVRVAPRSPQSEIENVSGVWGFATSLK